MAHTPSGWRDRRYTYDASAWTSEPRTSSPSEHRFETKLSPSKLIRCTCDVRIIILSSDHYEAHQVQLRRKDGHAQNNPVMITVRPCTWFINSAYTVSGRAALDTSTHLPAPHGVFSAPPLAGRKGTRLPSAKPEVASAPGSKETTILRRGGGL